MTDLLFVWMPVIAALFIVAFGVFLLFLGSRTYVKAVLLRRSGVTGVGLVTHHYEKKIYVNPKETHGEKTRYSQHINYEIHHDGKMYIVKDRQPSKALWSSLSVGGTVDVIYLPRNPKNSQLAETYEHAGIMGGTVQMIAGTVMVTAAAVFVLSGLWEAMQPPTNQIAQDDWVRDHAVIISIGKSDDPFLRIMQPYIRQVHIVVGDDDGGREGTGQVDILLGPNEYPELRVGDNLFVLRHPIYKDEAALQKVE